MSSSIWRSEFDHSVGWVAIHAVISAAEVAEILALCETLTQLPSAQRRAGDKVEGGTRHLVELDQRSKLIDSLLDRKPLAAVVSDILGPDYRRDQVSYRSPQPSFGGQRLHADDLPKVDLGPDRVATAIVALTDFTTNNGATRLVPGSHRRPDLQRLAGSLDGHPDEIVLTGPSVTPSSDTDGPC